MKKGDRVEIIDGVLRGERAIVEQVGTAFNGWNGFVFIRFDKDGTHLPDKGQAVLSPQWMEVERLKVVR